MTMDICVEALEVAIARYGTPTDQGSQFTSADFTKVTGQFESYNSQLPNSSGNSCHHESIGQNECRYLSGGL